jgi:hypothetical protein
MRKFTTSISIVFFTIIVLSGCGGSDDSCGCSDQDLQDFARSMNLTIDEAKEECCRLEKIANEMNAEQ